MDGCHLFITDTNVIAEMKNKSNSFSLSSDVTLIITHTASQRAQRRKDWIVSEPEVAKPNQIHFGTDNVRKKKCLNALVHFSRNLQNHFTLKSKLDIYIKLYTTKLLRQNFPNSTF